jgi:tRNA pseudouridine32 synthase / 23S rRNA pseudouridine746 synthase
MAFPLSPYHPPEGPLRILHADAFLLAVDKPAGLLSVPGRQARDDCLAARVQAQFGDALIVHRLDMATSGVVLFARGKMVLAHLSRQFEKRQAAKTYTALVIGTPPAPYGSIDTPLRCDWPNRPLQMICHTQGRQALTHWRMIPPDGSAHSRLELNPITGRSHQLRVHLASIGHPILGDEWYGQPGDTAPRLYLHARALTVHHPSNGVRVSFQSPDPF